MPIISFFRLAFIISFLLERESEEEKLKISEFFFSLDDSTYFMICDAADKESIVETHVVVLFNIDLRSLSRQDLTSQKVHYFMVTMVRRAMLSDFQTSNAIIFLVRLLTTFV